MPKSKHSFLKKVFPYYHRHLHFDPSKEGLATQCCWSSPFHIKAIPPFSKIFVFFSAIATYTQNSVLIILLLFEILCLPYLELDHLKE